MRKEFKYYQIAHPSLLLETDKMNIVNKENQKERETIYIFMKSTVYFRVSVTHPIDKPLIAI
jgi:hypothetical protein